MTFWTRYIFSYTKLSKLYSHTQSLGGNFAKASAYMHKGRKCTHVKRDLKPASSAILLKHRKTYCDLSRPTRFPMQFLRFHKRFYCRHKSTFTSIATVWHNGKIHTGNNAVIGLPYTLWVIGGKGECVWRIRPQSLAGNRSSAKSAFAWLFTYRLIQRCTSRDAWGWKKGLQNLISQSVSTAKHRPVCFESSRPSTLNYHYPLAL